MMDLLLDNPYFGYLAAKATFLEDDHIETTKTFFKQGIQVHYNPHWLKAQTTPHQKGALSHELLHLAFLHQYRRDGREPALWHMACDIAVSQFLPSPLIHEAIMTAREVFITSALRLPEKATAEVYYDLLTNIDETIDQSYNKGKAEIRFNKDTFFNMDLLEDIQKDDVQALAMIDELARLQHTSYGEEPIASALGAYTETIYESVKVNWRNILKQFLSGQGRVIKRKSYKRQSRRYAASPGSKRSVGLRALVAIDESASVSNKEVASFHKELIRINGITGTNLTAVRFDSTCSDPMSLQQFLHQGQRQKRGGTDFRPVFDMADQLKLPLVILFTDGQGQAPDQVNQHVLWVLTGNGKAPANYGMAVRFNEV